MNRDDFKVLQAAVTAHGFVIVDSDYSASSFGSWFVTVSTSPRRRVLWDGKDRWLFVQVETTELFEGHSVWRDLWIGTQPSEQNCDAAIQALVNGGAA